MNDLIGKLVKIEWRSPEDDWEYFIFLGESGQFVKLKGADNPINGDKHKGDEFYAPIQDIRTMKEAPQ